MNTEVVIITDSDIDERIQDRAQVLGAFMDCARSNAEWIFSTPIAEASGSEHQSYISPSLSVVEKSLLRGFRDAQSGNNKHYNPIIWKVNNSHHKIVNVDPDGNVYVIAELFEYDEPIMADFNWFVPCFAIGNSK